MIVTGIIAQAVETPKCPECGADLPSELTPLSETMCPACQKNVMVPGHLGQYHLTRLIGAGGMGAVYEGVDTGLQRKIAVKVILREKAEEDASFIESFKREAQSAARLNSPNIVGVYAFGESEGQPYLVMELVQPDALDKMMKSGPVNAATVMSIGRQVAQGLKAAAEQGLVHGDVKPENILINEAREAKLADFGIAALAGAKAAANNEVWGTPYYIAPETLRRQKVDLRADIYSLGATLYHAIAGVPPFEGETAVDVMKARLLGSAKPLQEVVPNCPEGIAKIVMRMLESEPIRRYPNYDSLLADINKEVGSGKTGAKRVVLKGAKSKTSNVTLSLNKPSQPMTPVENVNSSLFEKENSEGLSKGAIIGIGVGIGVAALVVLGVIIAIIINSAKKKPASEAGTPETAITAAVSQEALQAKADAAALAELGKRIDAAYAEQVAAQKAVVALKDRMINRSRRAVLPEYEGWLSPQEGEAPTEMLRELQRNFGRVEAITAAVTATESLRTKLDDWRTNYANASEIIAQANEAVAAYDALPEVKAFASNLKAIQDADKNWKKTVDKARVEMEKAVVAQREAAEKAEAAERERQAAEEAQRAIEAEVASVATIEVAITADLDKFLPETALATFKARQARLKSAEAKAAAEIVGERITAFQCLKTYWIEAIKKGQFKAMNVSAADDNTITVNKKTMSWQQFVSNQQQIAFRMIQSAIVDDTGARSIRASDRAELAVGAYLFVQKYFGTTTIEKSKALREAVEKLSGLATSLPGTRAKFERFVTPPAAE